MTDTPRLNLELLQRVRDKILADPEQHGQAEWLLVSPGPEHCLTAACVAGWACLLAGDEPAINRAVPRFDDQLWVGRVIDQYGAEHPVHIRARKLLGLDLATANSLFWPELTTEEVLDLLDRLIYDAELGR